MLAEATIGQRLQAPQEAGKIASREDTLKRGPDVRATDNGKATLPQIGIPRQRGSEYKTLADAEQDVE